MTTGVIVKVGGNYKATIKQDGKDPIEVLGNGAEGNTGGEHTIWLGHPATGKFEISEEYLGGKST